MAITGTTVFPTSADSFDVTKDDADLAGQDLADVRAAVNAIQTKVGTGALIAYARLVLTGSVVAGDLASALKPSGSATGTDESLRRLGTGATHAAAGDDSRFPTTGQKNALAGTSGTPGTGNEYVTDDDTRMAAAADLSSHLADSSDAHDASAISFTPTGTVAATDAQGAIAEVASEADTRLTVMEAAGGYSGQSLGTADNIGTAGAYTAPNAGVNDVTAGVTPTITIPASGRIRVEVGAPMFYGSLVGAVVALLYEAPVVAGVIGSYGATAVLSATRHITTANKGAPLTSAQPLARTPGDQFVYKLAVWGQSGSSVPTLTTFAFGGTIFIDVTAR